MSPLHVPNFTLIYLLYCPSLQLRHSTTISCVMVLRHCLFVVVSIGYNVCDETILCRFCQRIQKRGTLVEWKTSNVACYRSPERRFLPWNLRECGLLWSLLCGLFCDPLFLRAGVSFSHHRSVSVRIPEIESADFSVLTPDACYTPGNLRSLTPDVAPKTFSIVKSGSHCIACYWTFVQYSVSHLYFIFHSFTFFHFCEALYSHQYFHVGVNLERGT